MPTTTYQIQLPTENVGALSGWRYARDAASGIWEKIVPGNAYLGSHGEPFIANEFQCAFAIRLERIPPPKLFPDGMGDHMWMAFDSDGIPYWYASKPSRGKTIWGNTKEGPFFHESIAALFPGFERPTLTGDWRSSLVNAGEWRKAQEEM